MVDGAVDISLASLCTSTIKQYSSYIISWYKRCKTKDKNPFLISESDLLRELTQKFNEGASYSTLNTMRSALALISDTDFSKNKNISRFFKGAFKLRPPKPKYDSIWDVDGVLAELEKAYPLEDLNLADLTEKLVVLLALGSAHRLQTLALIKLPNMCFLNRGLEIRIPDSIKTSRPGAAQPLLSFPYLREKPSLCIAKTIERYIFVTKNLRNGCDNLIITVKQPHKAASTATISRWIRAKLVKCGVSENFTGYSTRHASTSAALKKGVSLSLIHKTAGWSQSSQMFAKFYNKSIELREKSFAEAVLS